MALLASAPSHTARQAALTTPPSAKPAPDPQNSAAHSLVAAELAFAKKAAEEGTDAAFLSVLDDRGVLFHPGPVNGKTWLRAHTPNASRLAWFPAYVEVSEAGDLGFSTGPYQWRPEAGSKEVAYGHFVSIWGRRGNVWKLLLDTGSPHAAPGEEDPVFEPENGKEAAKAGASPAFSAEDLQHLETTFARAAAAQGLQSAYRTYLAANARFYRAGALPTTQADEIRKALEQAKGTMTWTCLGSAVAISHDLGYAYGIAERHRGSGAGPGAAPEAKPLDSVYVHVWKRQPTGRWKVILDIENPLP